MRWVVPLWGTGFLKAADSSIMSSAWMILTTFLLSSRSIGVSPLAENIVLFISIYIPNHITTLYIYLHTDPQHNFTPQSSIDPYIKRLGLLWAQIIKEFIFDYYKQHQQTDLWIFLKYPMTTNPKNHSPIKKSKISPTISKDTPSSSKNSPKIYRPTHIQPHSKPWSKKKIPMFWPKDSM